MKIFCNYFSYNISFCNDAKWFLRSNETRINLMRFHQRCSLLHRDIWGDDDWIGFHNLPHDYVSFRHYRFPSNFDSILLIGDYLSEPLKPFALLFFLLQDEWEPIRTRVP